MFDIYAAAKLGRMRIAAFLSASSTTYQLVPAAQGEKSLYMLRPAAACYIIQGDSAALANGVVSTIGTRLVAGFYYPLLVEDLTTESFIAIRGVSTNDNLEITQISDTFRITPTWTLVEI